VDITIGVEPYHAREEKPKQALAARIAELLTADASAVTT
jgi:hypothetical protein